MKVRGVIAATGAPALVLACSISLAPPWVGGKHPESDTPMFPFMAAGRIGFIDRSGRIVIQPRFRGVERLDYFEGVLVADGTLFDTKGRTISHGPFGLTGRSSEGMIPAWLRDAKATHYDWKRRRILPGRFD